MVCGPDVLLRATCTSCFSGLSFESISQSSTNPSQTHSVFVWEHHGRCTLSAVSKTALMNIFHTVVVYVIHL